MSFPSAHNDPPRTFKTKRLQYDHHTVAEEMIFFIIQGGCQLPQLSRKMNKLINVYIVRFLLCYKTSYFLLSSVNRWWSGFLYILHLFCQFTYNVHQQISANSPSTHKSSNLHIPLHSPKSLNQLLNSKRIASYEFPHPLSFTLPPIVGLTYLSSGSCTMGWTDCFLHLPRSWLEPVTARDSPTATWHLTLKVCCTTILFTDCVITKQLYQCCLLECCD